jgi:hypothetical protein
MQVEGKMSLGQDMEGLTKGTSLTGAHGAPALGKLRARGQLGVEAHGDGPGHEEQCCVCFGGN